MRNAFSRVARSDSDKRDESTVSKVSASVGMSLAINELDALVAEIRNFPREHA